MSNIDHASRDHALLSASGASRWLACPPSARLEDEIEDKTSVFAIEGTLAHEICEILVKKEFKQITKSDATKQLKALKKDPLYNEGMLEYCQDYANYIVEKANSKDAVVIIEERLDFSKYVPEGFGTGDCIVINDNTLSIIDFKYGSGVKVDAQDNAQMKLYALGAIDRYDFIYDFDKVEMCIFQPRINNISEDALSISDLISWGENVVKPTAKLAYGGNGEFKAGSHCKFCKISSQCKKLKDYCFTSIRDEFEDESGKLDINLLTPKDYAEILGKTKVIQDWLKSVEIYAINQVLEGNLEVPGYKVVEGRSVRSYSDQDLVVQKLVNNSIPEAVIFEKKLLGITAMEKAIGKAAFKDLLELDGLVIKPKGKPTIVPNSDKRPVYSIINDFDIEQ